MIVAATLLSSIIGEKNGGECVTRKKSARSAWQSGGPAACPSGPSRLSMDFLRNRSTSGHGGWLARSRRCLFPCVWRRQAPRRDQSAQRARLDLELAPHRLGQPAGRDDAGAVIHFHGIDLACDCSSGHAQLNRRPVIAHAAGTARPPSDSTVYLFANQRRPPSITS